jgi:predicted transcriptional regulator of viral defense system
MPKKRLERPKTLTAVTQLAARQHGVIGARQLYSLGLSERQVRTLVAGGWLLRLHRGVCAVGHRPLANHGRWMAAVLAGGETAVLSHEAAAELWELRRPRSRNGRIDITIRSQRGAARRQGNGHPPHADPHDR